MYATLYKLFRAPCNRNLKRLTWIAHDIWNYFLGWQRTRYALGLPYMSFSEMSRQFTILRKAHPEVFAHWRENHHWKLAKRFVHKYDALCFETLTFEGMKRLWGRKVSDIAPYAFHQKLKHQASKHGKAVHYIDRFEATSKTCSTCEQPQMIMDLSVREWRYPSCQTHHHRDVNAAINIVKVGASTFGLEGVRLAIASDPRRLQPKSEPHDPHRKAMDS